MRFQFEHNLEEMRSGGLEMAFPCPGASRRVSPPRTHLDPFG